MAVETAGAALAGVGIWVENDFLAPAERRALRECAELRRQRGDFNAARIGGELSLQHRAEIRGDSTCWIIPPLLPPEVALLGALEQLRLNLNRDLTLGLFDLELHYAWYPPGAGYARHVDQPSGTQQRQVSLIVYLNEVWNCADGGELRIFDADGEYRDIAPLAGRLVCFLTAERQHAVRQTHQDRVSISGWFRARD